MEIKSIIGLIMIVGWVIFNLIKDQQDNKNKTSSWTTPTTPPQDPGTGTAAPAPRDELSKFLEEVRRRKAEDDRTFPTPVQTVPPPKPLPVEMPRRTAPATPPRAKERARTETAATVPVEVVPAQVAQPMQLTGTLLVAQNIPNRRLATPAVGVALDLLKNQQSLTAAFILREVFDPPLSKRHRRAAGK